MTSTTTTRSDRDQLTGRSPVRDLMSHPVVTADPGQRLATAADAMVLAGVGSVVVVGEPGRPIGILTERDLVRASAAGTDTRGAPAAPRHRDTRCRLRALWGSDHRGVNEKRAVRSDR